MEHMGWAVVARGAWPAIERQDSSATAIAVLSIAVLSQIPVLRPNELRTICSWYTLNMTDRKH